MTDDTLAMVEALARASEKLKEANDRPYGPAFLPEDAKPAGEACVALCEGNANKGRSLWKLIVEDLDAGYMPHAACVALIRAANTVNIIPDIEAPEL